MHEHRALRALAPDLAVQPALLLIWQGRGFAGDDPKAFLNRYGITSEIVGSKHRQGFQLEERRCKAEQTFGCLQRYWRLRVDDEMSCASARAMALLAALFLTRPRGYADCLTDPREGEKRHATVPGARSDQSARHL